MDRDLISSLAHRWHPIAAPLSSSSVSTLIHRAGVRPGDRVLDLGCGQGAWLICLLEQHPGVTAVGVDRSAAALATAGASSSGVAERVEWVEADAAAWRGERFDVVLCVGASHVFGGLTGMLAALRRHLAPGGRVIVGDTVWDAPPSPRTLEALEAVPDDFPDAAGLVATAREHGLEPSYGHISTLAEWDEYEWCWTGSLTQWALTEAPSAQREEALRIAAEHRSGWLDGYRGELGFTTLVCHDVAAGPPATETEQVSDAVVVDEVPAEVTYPLRRAVLRPNGGEITWAGDEDPATFHLAARAGDRVVGVVRFSPAPCPWRPDTGSPWQLRGMATDPAVRGTGAGRALVVDGLARVAARGGDLVWCDARIAAAGFYERMGFTVVSEPFDKPGIGPHVGMLIEPSST